MALYQCEKCGQLHRVYRSCGNRHCPSCQHHKTRQWLEKQIKRQLPGHHFLLTFTVPEKLRRFIRKNQRVAYSALFKASSEAIKKLAPDEHYIGGDLPGFFGVLHTWGRTLEFHPHIHYVVPGGALSTTDALWHPSRIDFYLPVRALSQIFKAKFRDEMKQAASLRSNPSRSLADRLERQFPSRRFQRSNPQIPCPLRLQSCHLQFSNPQSREPHGLHSLPKTSQPPLKNPCPGGHGVYPALLTARPTHRVHESPLLWIHESQLWSLS